MTFGKFVLRLRARLQDRRTSAGVTITGISTSGVRWSSDELIEIANQAIVDAIRTIHNHPTSNLFKQLGQSVFQATGTVAISSGSANLPSNILDITRLTEDGISNRDREFQRRAVDEFYGALVDDSEPLRNAYLYTVVFDAGSGLRKVMVKPSDYSQNVRYTGIYSKSNYTSADTAVELFLQGMDDFLLDIAEREARDREHNWDRSKILDFRIAMKLGISLRGEQ